MSIRPDSDQREILKMYRNLIFVWTAVFFIGEGLAFVLITSLRQSVKRREVLEHR